MSVTFTCEVCKQTIQSTWTEEESLAEKESNWGDAPIDQCVAMCGDCYEKFMDWYNSSIGHA
jgi:hypothetical protein